VEEGRDLTRERGGLALFALNFMGAVIYMVAASRGWVNAQERAQGLDSVTAEPFIWAMYVFPIWVLFVLLNLIWGGVVLARRNWRCGILWLMILPVWVAALAIDFAPH